MLYSRNLHYVREFLESTALRWDYIVMEMIGHTILQYKILEKLGEGGMGVVYKAQDTKLNRTVALKFLPQHLTSTEEERARFMQEAQAAAALNHPHICTIYGIEEYEGKQFIEMEYVDGVTLRSKVAEKKSGSFFPVNDAVSLAIQIGEALQEAHAKGIVHRDIKAENIMINARNQVKVMDFGLAKLKGSMKLTRTSSTVGTLAYMAPEQIQGGDVDARSDIFSFGVVVFEILSGHLPFRGEHDAAMMYSILNEEPESLLKNRNDLPTDLDRIVHRALEKDPGDRYQHVDDMVSEFRRLQKQTSRVVRPDVAVPRSDQQAEVGKSTFPKKIFLLGIAGLIIVAVLISLFLFRSGGPVKTGLPAGRKMLTVLPFENLGSPDQEYFADGITEEITSKLSSLSGLGVIARSSAMQYKKTTKPVKQIGDELGVSYILQGTVRWENSGGAVHVRVTPQLINVADGTQIWSQPSEAVMASAFTLQSDIAAQVASALDLTLLQGEKQSLAAMPTENSAAYDYYLRANEYMYRSTQESDYRVAEQMLEQAVRADQNFALAYARLGELNSHIYWEYYDHTDQRVRKSKEAAEHALQLDPTLPDAHGAMGWYYYHCLRDYAKAIKEFGTALSAQPNNIDLLLGIGSVYRRQGDFENTLKEFKLAQQIDPRSPAMAGNVAETEIFMRNYSDARRTLDLAMALAPTAADWYCDRTLLEILSGGNIAAAQSSIDEAMHQSTGEGNLLVMYMQLWLGVLRGDYRATLKRLDSLDVAVFTYQSWYIPRQLLHAQIEQYLGQGSQARQDYDAARIILEAELKRHPDDPRMYTSLGLAYAGLGRKADAIRVGKKGVEIIPLSQDAIAPIQQMEDLSRIYARVGEDDLAIDILQQLLSMPADISASMIRLDPSWKPLHGNSRFEKLLAEKL